MAWAWMAYFDFQNKPFYNTRYKKSFQMVQAMIVNGLIINFPDV